MTSIEWTHVPDGKGGRKKGETCNPQDGCSEISPGCRNCYAARVAHRGMSKHHRGLTVLRSNGPHWNGQINRAPDQLEKPLRWRDPRGIFWGSMTDLFHESVMATEDGRRYIAACFGVMAATPQHTHMVLTKRPALMREWFKWLATADFMIGAVRGAQESANVWRAAERQFAPADAADDMRLFDRLRSAPRAPWPLPNVWVGTTTEDQQRADERVPELLHVPAAVRFLSMEPLLGPVVIPEAFFRGPAGSIRARRWVIAGGESGPGARPMHPAWVRSIRDQCVEARVPFFFKQNGAWAVEAEADDTIKLPWFGERDVNRVHVTDVPTPVMMRRVGKGKSGRELDGRTWDEFPEVTEHG